MKDELKEKIERYGGCFESNLESDRTTHLIAQVRRICTTN